MVGLRGLFWPVTVMKTDWFVYLLKCADGTLYAGITTDPTRREAEHNGLGRVAGAKYTKARRPVQLVYQETVPSRSAALQREAAIRQLSRREK